VTVSVVALLVQIFIEPSPDTQRKERQGERRKVVVCCYHTASTKILISSIRTLRDSKSIFTVSKSIFFFPFWIRIY
jgi:hypothetical protein